MTAGKLRSGLLRCTVARRSVTIPALVLCAVLAAVILPIIGAFTIVGAPWSGAQDPDRHGYGGRRRALRLAAFTGVYLAAECYGLIWATALWMRKVIHWRMSADEYQHANYALLARMLGWLYAAGESLSGLRILPPVEPGVLRSTEPTATPAISIATVAPELPTGPLLVLSRHGGPGDSFLLVHALLVHGHRKPRIVLKDTLAFNPLIDVVLGRVPHCFIRPDPDNGERVAAEIGRLAEGMRPGDALLVFPEGGNFTPHRRIRAIDRLRRRGLRESANRAQRLRYVLPPRPAGVFAAIDAMPGADVVFVAHTGLDHMQSFADVWHGIPLAEPVEVTWWTVSARQVPRETEDRMRWLQDNWDKVDEWIGRHRTIEIEDPLASPVSPVLQPVRQSADENVRAGAQYGAQQ